MSMRTPALRSLALAAGLAVTPLTLAAEPGEPSGIPRARLVGEAVTIARPLHSGGLGRIAARPAGGLAVAYASDETLLAAKHAADLEREDLLRLGNLGYSGRYNIASLAAVAPDLLAVSWSVDHHYAGDLGAYVALWTHQTLRRRHLGKCCAPLLVADRNGGVAGVARTSGDQVSGWRSRFQRWDSTGTKIAERTLPGMGYPVQARPFAGGLLVVRQQQPGKARWMEHLDLAGRILAAAPNFGTALATDGGERIVEAGRSPTGRSLVARFRSALAGGTVSRRLATAPLESNFASFDLALDPRGTGLLAWSLEGPATGCAIRVRPFAADGSALGGELCAADRGYGARLAIIGPGEFWLVWEDRTETLGRGSILARKVRVD